MNPPRAQLTQSRQSVAAKEYTTPAANAALSESTKIFRGNTHYVFRITDLFGFDADAWLVDPTITVLDALASIILYTHCKRCIERPLTVPIDQFLFKVQDELTGVAVIKFAMSEGQITIGRCEKNRLQFRTSRTVNGIPQPFVVGEIGEGNEVNWQRAAGYEVNGHLREAHITPKAVAKDMLICLQELQKVDFNPTGLSDEKRWKRKHDELAHADARREGYEVKMVE